MLAPLCEGGSSSSNLAELGCLAGGGFDHAACLFSTLGMVVGADVRRRVVGHAFRLLRPGGRFILHVHNRWFHLRDGSIYKNSTRWLLGMTLIYGIVRREPVIILGQALATIIYVRNIMLIVKNRASGSQTLNR